MTIRTMIEHLRKHVDAKNDAQLAQRIGISRCEISRIVNNSHSERDKSPNNSNERGFSVRLPTLLRISNMTGVRIGTLAEWWAEGYDVTQVYVADAHKHKRAESQSQQVAKATTHQLQSLWNKTVKADHESQ